MGYVKDNFPNSPAYFQRLKVAKGLVVYAVIAGGLFAVFSPYSKHLQQAHKEGLWDNPEWVLAYRRRMSEGGFFGTRMERKPTDKVIAHRELTAGMDFTAPKEIRKQHAQLGTERIMSNAATPSSDAPSTPTQ